MPWTNNDFRTYPSRCFSAHEEAVAASPEHTLLGTWKHQSDAQAEALLLRKFRYLVRANPGTDFSLDKLLSDYDFRTKLLQNHFGDWSLLLRAKPSFAAELASLNPGLAGTMPK